MGAADSKEHHSVEEGLDDGNMSESQARLVTFEFGGLHKKLWLFSPVSCLVLPHHTLLTKWPFFILVGRLFFVKGRHAAVQRQLPRHRQLKVR